MQPDSPSSSMRHRVAPAWLAGLRLWRGITGAPSGVRIMVLHDTPPGSLDTLRSLADVLNRDGTLCGPAAFETACAADGPRYMLSFDDGFASNLEAARTLAEAGVSALFCVCPALLDLDPAQQRAAMAKAFFAGGPVPEGCRLLSWNEVGEISSLGHVIGAHGMTHARLTGLRGDELTREIADAGTMIGERLGARPDWYAYSYGDIGSISAEALAVIARHYRYCRSGVRGINTPATRQHALRGEEFRLDAPPAYRHLVLEGGLDARYRDARASLDAMAASGTGAANQATGTENHD